MHSGGSTGGTAGAAHPYQGGPGEDNKLFITLARKAFKWDEPSAPSKSVGPLLARPGRFPTSTD